MDHQALFGLCETDKVSFHDVKDKVFEYQKTKDEKILSEIIEHYRFLAVSIALRYEHSDFEDYLSEAIVGLIEAVQKFEAGKAYLDHFVYRSMWGSAWYFFRCNKGDRSVILLNDTDYDEKSHNPSFGFRSMLSDFENSLSDKDFAIFELRRQGLTLKEIKNELGLDCHISTVCRALKKIKQKAKKGGLF